MARFYGSMKGHGSKSNTKMGASHIEAHIRTWDHGIFVKYELLSDDRIRCEVYSTGGSYKPTVQRLIKAFTIKDPGNIRPGTHLYGQPQGNSVTV